MTTTIDWANPSHYVLALEAINAETADVMAREQIEVASQEEVLTALKGNRGLEVEVRLPPRAPVAPVQVGRHGAVVALADHRVVLVCRYRLADHPVAPGGQCLRGDHPAGLGDRYPVVRPVVRGDLHRAVQHRGPQAEWMRYRPRLDVRQYWAVCWDDSARIRPPHHLPMRRLR